MKDKTIKSPVIQSRYTWSNWCVALWRAGSNVGTMKGGRALVNNGENSEKNERWHREQTLSRQGYCLGSNFRGAPLGSLL